MPAFRFELSRDVARDTVQDIELDSNDAAIDEARQAARDTMMDGLIEGVDTSAWAMSVFDQAGCLVVTLRFADLLHKEGEPPSEASRPRRSRAFPSRSPRPRS